MIWSSSSLIYKFYGINSASIFALSSSYIHSHSFFHTIITWSLLFFCSLLCYFCIFSRYPGVNTNPFSFWVLPKKSRKHSRKSTATLSALPCYSSAETSFCEFYCSSAELSSRSYSSFYPFSSSSWKTRSLSLSRLLLLWRRSSSSDSSFRLVCLLRLGMLWNKYD